MTQLSPPLSNNPWQWTEKDWVNGLKETGKKKVAIRTILTSSPDVVEKFKKSDKYPVLMATGDKTFKLYLSD